jgi:hypothetical protein
MAHDISQQAEPDARSIQPCNLCIYCEEDVPSTTTLTGDVPSWHLMCLVPFAGRRCQTLPVDSASDQSTGKQYARAERHVVLISPSTRSFPCTSRIHRSRASGHKEIVLAPDISGSKHYILYVPAPLCMPPFSYKRGGMRRYIGHAILDHTLDSQAHTSSQAILLTVE